MRRVAWALALMTFAAAGVMAQSTEPQPDADGVYSPGKGITSPKLVRAVRAVYPSDAPPPGGKVSRTLSVVIGADGTPSKIAASGVNSDPFSLAAIAAVRQSSFTPGALRDSPIPVRVLVWIPIVPGGKPRAPEILPIAYDQPPMPVRTQEPRVPNELNDPTGNFKYTAVALVSLVVTDDGLPTDLRITKSVGKDLDEKALEAIQQYRFKPAMKYGMPIPAQVEIQIVFHLSKKP